MVATTQQQSKAITTLGPYDIVCGRCSTAFNNIGNRRFRITIQLNLPRYVQANTRQEKGEVIRFVVDLLRNEVGARFVKKTKTGDYIELDERHTRQKVGHALRDMHVQKSMTRSNSSSSLSSETPSTTSTETAATASSKPAPPPPKIISPSPTISTRKSHIDMSALAGVPSLQEEPTEIMKQPIRTVSIGDDEAQDVYNNNTQLSPPQSAILADDILSSIDIVEDRKEDAFAMSEQEIFSSDIFSPSSSCDEDVTKPAISIESILKTPVALFQDYLDNMPERLEHLDALMAIDIKEEDEEQYWFRSSSSIKAEC